MKKINMKHLKMKFTNYIPQGHISKFLDLFAFRNLLNLDANFILFFLGPTLTLVFLLLGYALIPLGSDLANSEYDLMILFI